MRYSWVDAALVRFALHASTDLPAWPQGAAADAEDEVREWRSWLDQLWTRTGIGEAIAEASPTLADRVEQIRVGHPRPVRDVRRAGLAVARYALRATSRATPFGLFSGVASVHKGGETTLRWGTQHRAHARMDAVWLARVLRQLERCRALQRSCTVVVTDLAAVRDDQVVVPHQARVEYDEPTDVFVRCTAAVEAVLAYARTPISQPDLVAKLGTDFAHTAPAVIEDMVGTLIEQGVLLTALRPPMTSTDPLGHLVSHLARVDLGSLPDDVSTVISEVRKLHADLARHNAASPVEPAATRTAVADRAAAVASSGDKPAVAVDVRADCTLGLPTPVWQEATSAVETLVRLSPHPYGSSEWTDYHHRFLERYGRDAHVPLRALLDPTTGLGYPAGYRGAPQPAAAPSVSDRDTQLLTLAQQAALDRAREVHLDEATIVELAEVAPDTPCQPHGELSFRLYAADRAAVDQGDFQLAVAGVSRAAGTLTGRFLDLLTEPDRDRIADAYTRLPTSCADALPVQISAPPLHTRTENVARNPQVHPHLLTLGEHREPATDRIPLDELTVTGDTDRLYLLRRTDGRVIEPVLLNAVELTHRVPPLVRFLTEIATAATPTLGPFSWGAAASHLPYLPRVRVGRSILAPAQWRLDPQELPRTRDPRQWSEVFDAWRERRQVPTQVYAGDGDRRFLLDLTEPVHQELLRAEATRDRPVVLREAPPAEAFGWCQGRAHELVVPFASTTNPSRGPHRPNARATAAAVVREREHEHLPGAGTWLFAKLYADPDRQTTLLTQHLPRLLDRWDTPPDWWFLRYADPDPPHLRLRIRLHSPDEFGTTAQHVAGWATELRRQGSLGGLGFDTYRPEVGRFGPGTAMDAAETVFVADSAAALAQLTHTRTTEAAQDDAVAAASLVQLVLSYLGDRDAGMAWLVENLPRTRPAAIERDRRAEAVRLASPDDDWAAILRRPGGDQLLDAWRDRARALTAYRDHYSEGNRADPAAILPDLLHLHTVRITGLSRDREHGLLYLARAAALSWTSRQGTP